MSAFAADRPLGAPPDTRFNYSTGTSLVVSGIVARALGPDGPYREYLDERLFGPLGMSSAATTFDDAGTFWAAGHDGQFIDVVPGLDLVVVRLGRTGSEHAQELRAWRDAVIRAFG
ncbi:MAG TPA: serine hydrolase [Acidimicrobiales bacterium]